MNARFRLASRISLAALLVVAAVHAQTPAPPLAPAPPIDTASRAWTLLANNVAEDKHIEDRVLAFAALGIIGNEDRAARLIDQAFTDKSLDIRTAAILAAGESNSQRYQQRLRNALDDAEPQVAYTAAVTLWKMHDRSGEELLTAIVEGDRRANAPLMKGARHTAYLTMHNPGALAKLGATEGASMLLGPFGFGLTAVEYARKNGGNSARVTSIDLLSTEHTEAVHQTLIEALDDKDTAVRVAAAKALCLWPGATTAKALSPWIDDPKLPVRLTSAAAYLRVTGTASRPGRRH